MVLQLFGVTLVMPGRMKECLGSWRGQKSNRTIMQIWRMVPLCNVVSIERKECKEF